jgi:hypothetical protein
MSAFSLQFPSFHGGSKAVNSDKIGFGGIFDPQKMKKTVPGGRCLRQQSRLFPSNIRPVPRHAKRQQETVGLLGTRQNGY